MKRIFKIIYRYKNCLKDFMLSERFKSTVFLLGKNILEPNRLVALGTIILAFFTYKSIGVSQKMVDETKRLATISQEQFKIKSYPLLFTEVSPFTIENGKTMQRIKIVNRGEIAAFRLSAMILHGFGELDNNFRLKVMTGGTYKIKNDVLNFTYQEEYTMDCTLPVRRLGLERPDRV